MKVKVTTREFIRLLRAAREFDRQFPWLGQVVWLLDHWTDVTDDYVGLVSRISSGWQVGTSRIVRVSVSSVER